MAFPYLKSKERRKHSMEVISMFRTRPYKGKYLTRGRANRINDALLNSEVPDRTELKKEAKEFIEFIRNKRACEKR